MLFMGAMLGVIFSDNILVLYVFWELTSISSFLLIAYWYQREAITLWCTKIIADYRVWRTCDANWIHYACDDDRYI